MQTSFLYPLKLIPISLNQIKLQESSFSIESDSPDYWAELTSSLILNKGIGDPSFTRTTTATVTDFEGIVRTVKSGEARFEGARRVENLYVNSQTLVTQGITVIVGTYTVSFTGTGTITFSGAYSGTLIGIGSNNRVEITFSTIAGTLTSTVTGSVLKAQCENVTGQSTSVASEYISNGVLSAPYHGAGVDGVKYFKTKLDGTLISNSILKGYLAEGQRSNLLQYSQDFSNAIWLKTTASIGTNVAISPSGRNTASKLIDTVDDSSHRVYQQISGSATTYTFSVYVKAAERLYTGVQIITDSSTNKYTAIFNLSNGTFVSSNTTGTPTGTGYSINSIGNGWYRVSVTATNTSGLVYGVITPSDSGNPAYSSSLPKYIGDGVSGIYIWGTQLESANFSSSYIPTTTASVTRNGDALNYLANPNIGEKDFSISFEMIRNNNSTGAFPQKSPIQIGTYPSNASVNLGGYSTNRLGTLVNFGSVWSLVGVLGLPDITFGILTKLAFRLSKDLKTFSGFRDGVKGTDIISTDIKTALWAGSPSKIGIASSVVGTTDSDQSLNIKNIKIWKRLVKDSTLINSTR